MIDDDNKLKLSIALNIKYPFKYPPFCRLETLQSSMVNDFNIKRLCLSRSGLFDSVHDKTKPI